jgi:hypothetical protein
VGYYQSENFRSVSNSDNLDDIQRTGSGKVRFRSIEISSIGKDGTEESFLRAGQDLRIRLNIACYEAVSDIMTAIIIYDTQGYRLVDANTALQGGYFDMEPNEGVEVEFILEDVLLKSGTYLVGLWIGRENSEEMDVITYARRLSVEIDSNSIMHHREFPGVYQCRFTHNIQHLTPNFR